MPFDRKDLKINFKRKPINNGARFNKKKYVKIGKEGQLMMRGFYIVFIALDG